MFFEEFRRPPTISEDLKKMKNAGRLFLSILQLFPKIFVDFRRRPKTSANFRKLKKIKKCWRVVLRTLRQFSDFSEYFRKFSKVLETCRNVCFCTLQCFFISFSKNFQTFNKGDMNLYFREPIDRSI